MKKYEDSQIRTLKYLIGISKEADNVTKIICLALIDASEEFSKNVKYSYNLLKVIDDRLFGIENMTYPNSSTHLNELLSLLGTKFKFYEKRDLGKVTHFFYLSDTDKFSEAEEIKKEFLDHVKLSDVTFEKLIY